MSKFTGKECYAVKGENGVYTDWAGKKVRLATVHAPDWHEDYICGSREAFANAKLYASAPDMYEALEELLSAVDSHNEANNATMIDPHATAAARTALAKAGAAHD